VKFRTIIVTSLLQKLIIKCFNKEVKASNKNCKVNESAVCFLYNSINFDYKITQKEISVLFYSRNLYCFNHSLLFSLGEKWVALKTAGCWVALKRTGFVNNLDLHYKHKAVSKKISKSYNFGLL